MLAVIYLAAMTSHIYIAKLHRTCLVIGYIVYRCIFVALSCIVAARCLVVEASTYR